jgi:putative MFS transporter
MAEGSAAPPIAAPSWLSTTLNGPGEWRLRRLVPYLFGLIMLFDSWDSVVIAFTLPPIAKAWSLDPLSSGWLISSGYAGQLAGAIAFGALAEAKGRLPVLRALVIAMCLLAVGCGLAQDYGQLIALRLAQGLAIGGALPVAISYLNEIAPTAVRGRFFGTYQFLMVSGFSLASLASAWIVPAFGWRPMYLLGAAPLVLAPFLFALPESPRWLAGRGRVEAAVKALLRLGGRPDPAQAVAAPPAPKPPPATVLLSPRLRGLTGVTALLWLLTSLVSYGLVTWIPSIYVGQFHIPLARALQYNAIASIFVLIIPLVLRQTIDRFGRRPPVILGTGVGALALLALTVAGHGREPLVVGLTIMGSIGISIGSMVLWPYTSEVYQTNVRAAALGASSSLARAASMSTPLVVGGLLAATGSIAPVFLVFGLSAGTVALLWIFATRETAGRELDG